MKICLIYHGLFFMGTPPELSMNAVSVIHDQMEQLRASGLADATSEFHVGLNGGQESFEVARLVFPFNAKIHLHGLQCKNECRTIRMLEEWLPGHDDWYVLYFHAKGSTSAPERQQMSERWRACMMRHCISNWRRCVEDLDAGCEAVGCHWMVPPATPFGQHIFAGTFFWARASFLLTLPSIMDRARIKLSGIDSLDSRYEAEVWLGNGPRLPKIKDYHGPMWNPGMTGTCSN